MVISLGQFCIASNEFKDVYEFIYPQVNIFADEVKVIGTDKCGRLVVGWQFPRHRSGFIS